MSKPLTPHAAFPLGGHVISMNSLGLPAIMCGATVPADATAGYGVGCMFIHDDGSGAFDVLYKNVGTATSCDFDSIADTSSGQIVNVAAASTALALTKAAHANRIVIVPIITGAGLTITLPAATGTGDRYRIINNGVQTVSLTVTALTGDIMSGIATGNSLTAGANDTFVPTAADIKYTFNVTTTGGDGGDTMELIDIATDSWWVKVDFHGSGTLATGFA